MLSLATDLPFSRPEVPEELRSAFGELWESVTRLAGDRPDYHEAHL
jgi:hypothetical protein